MAFAVTIRQAWAAYPKKPARACRSRSVRRSSRLEGKPSSSGRVSVSLEAGLFLSSGERLWFWAGSAPTQPRPPLAQTRASRLSSRPTRRSGQGESAPGNRKRRGTSKGVASRVSMRWGRERRAWRRWPGHPGRTVTFLSLFTIHHRLCTGTLGRKPSPSPCYFRMQHFLYFFPLPQGHGSFRPTRLSRDSRIVVLLRGAAGTVAWE